MATSNFIRHFNFTVGQLTYNTRGLTDIEDILKEYEFTDEDIEIKDEFELVYENINTTKEGNV